MKGTGEQGAGLSPVINPKMKWTVRGAGMRTGRVGHQVGLDSATMVPELARRLCPSVGAFWAVYKNVLVSMKIVVYINIKL